MPSRLKNKFTIYINNKLGTNTRSPSCNQPLPRKKYILKFFSGEDHMTFEGGVGDVFSKFEQFWNEEISYMYILY